MIKKLVVLLSLAILLNGCMPPPKLQPVSPYTKVYAPAAPANQDLSTKFYIKKTPTKQDELVENTTVKYLFKVQPNSRIVISVPVDQQRNEKLRDMRKNSYSSWANRDFRNKLDEKSLNDMNKSSAERPDAERREGSFTFSTAGYFNKAEQEIEKSLLRKNFNVLDRSKFEAELRSRRTRESSSKTSDSQKEEIKSLEEQRIAKRITRDEYLERLRDIESKYAIFERNEREAGDNELVDISELIRAAESGIIQADYILQVNNFKIDAISDTQLYVSEHEKVQSIIANNSGLLNKLEEKGIDVINQPGYYGYLNAKLIEVKTGAIVWVGEHRVESKNVEDISVGLSIAKEVSNASEVNGIANTHNNNLASLKNKALNIAQKIKKDGLSNDQQNSLVVQYDNTVADLNNNNNKQLSYPDWNYKYVIGSPRINPMYPSRYEMQALERKSKDSQKDQNQFIKVRNRMDRHQGELAKLVSKELIYTIPTVD